jgi:hypothetical protein
MKRCIVLLSLLAVGILVMGGCAVDDSSDGAGVSAASINPATDIQPRMARIGASLNLTRVALWHAIPFVVGGPNAGAGVSACPEVTWDVDWRGLSATATIDYGEGCPTRVGFTAAGVITVELSFEDGAVPVDIAFDGFSLNGVGVAGEVWGEMRLIHFGFAGALTFTDGEEVSDLAFDQSVLDIDLGGTVFDPADDSVYLFGGFTFTDPDGKEYGVSVPDDEAVTFGGGCVFPLTGKVYADFFLYVPLTAWVDFSYPTPGACDSQFDYGFDF